MIQYIDKLALVAEIEKLKEKYALCPTRNNYEEGLKEGRLIGYKDALHKLDTLEVKEVDLEKEIDKELDEEWYGEYISHKKFKKSAKHFFELGIKAKKGE